MVLPLLATRRGTLLVAPGMASGLAFSRASAATVLGADDATWSEVANDIARFQGSPRRLLIEGARTDAIRNARLEGSVPSVAITPVAVSAAVISGGGTLLTLTVPSGHGVNTFGLITLAGFTPTALNRTFGVGTVTATTIQVSLGTALAQVDGAVSVIGTYTATSPGGLPTNFAISHVLGLGRQVVGNGTTNGVPWVDIRVAGYSADAQLWANIAFETTGQSPALLNTQPCAMSCFAAVVAGSLIQPFRFALQLLTSGLVSISYLTGTSLSLNGALTRQFSTLTANDAACAFAREYFWSGSGANQTIDFTLRLALPQQEANAAFASSPIQAAAGSPAVSTRAIDVATASLASLGITGPFTLLWSGVIPQAAPAGLNQTLINIDDGNVSNRYIISNPGGGTTISASRVNAGVSVGTANAGSFTPGAAFRVGITVDALGRIAISMEGGAVQAATGGITSGLTTLRLGNNAGGSLAMFGETAYLRTLNYAASDAELQALVAGMPTS